MTTRRSALPSTTPRRLALLGVVAALAAASVAAPLAAQQSGASTPPTAPATQPAGFRSHVLADLDHLSQKFAGLAQAMAGKYDWRPGQGVRSAGEVFNLIVMENRMLAGTLTGATTPAGLAPAPITDAAQLQGALRTTYASLRQTLAALPEAELNAPVRLFGRETTKQGALYLLLTDQHEHLGQSIAYARSNGVVPPWSQKAR